MKYLIGYPVMALVCYLMFSFITFNLHPAEWTENYRILCSIFSVVWGTALAYRINKDCVWSF
jgi:hypothetical protein